MKKAIIAIDPGKDKCGVACGNENTVFEHKTVLTCELYDTIFNITERYDVDIVVCGNSTHASDILDLIKPLEIKTALVDETNSTYEARKLYFADNPPRFLKKLIPITMQYPPVPIDDYAAIIILQRYLKK